MTDYTAVLCYKAHKIGAKIHNSFQFCKQFRLDLALFRKSTRPTPKRGKMRFASPLPPKKQVASTIFRFTVILTHSILRFMVFELENAPYLCSVKSKRQHRLHSPLKQSDLH